MAGIINTLIKSQEVLTSIFKLPVIIKFATDKMKTVMMGVNNPITIHEYLRLIFKLFFLIKRVFVNIPDRKKQPDAVIKKSLNFPNVVAYIINNPEAKNQTEKLIKYLIENPQI